MLGRLYIIVLAALAFVAIASSAPAADYRGMTAGWPAYANGYYAANYPAGYATGPAYYVARPVAAAGYAGPSAGTMYRPVTAAYANPNYFAAYGRSPVAYRPVSTAGYAPAGAYYAPAAGVYDARAAQAPAYYAPVTANYAPANSYAATPAGFGSAGSEAAAYYGQPTALNYVPPRFAYRTNYAPTPVYMYRPVTAYDPITAQPVTCLQASTATSCQPQRSRCFSLLNPFSWFGRGNSCGSGGCGSTPVPTTAYCGTAASQCGQQPYYPVQPFVPVNPAPMITLPPNQIPAYPQGFVPPAGTRVPPPPTGAAAPRGVIINPGLSPADLQPRLQPGTTFGPAPGGTFSPGGTFTPLPSNPAPGGGGFTAPPGSLPPSGGSFQTTPGSSAPPTGFGTGGFGTGANYVPAVDPYGSSTTLTPANNAAQAGNNNVGPNHSVFGSGYRGAPARPDSTRGGDSNVIRAPDLGPAMPPSVQTVPDLDAPQTPRSTNIAPQLLDPRDKTAALGDRRWAVVPAVWPQKHRGPQEHSERPVVQTKAQQPALNAGLSNGDQASSPASSTSYDDRGWKTGAF